MQTLFIFIGLISVIVFIASTVMIYSYLKDRGEKVSFLWIRVLMISYASPQNHLDCPAGKGNCVICSDHFILCA